MQQYHMPPADKNQPIATHGRGFIGGGSRVGNRNSGGIADVGEVGYRRVRVLNINMIQARTVAISASLVVVVRAAQRHAIIWIRMLQ